MWYPHLTSAALSAALFTVASPAFAQDICGGLGTGGQWIGGSEGASDIATTSSVQEQMALVLGGNEYVALFSVSSPTDIRVEAQGRGAADPQIDLFDSAGGIVASDDDSGGEGAARAEITLDTGTYCLAVRSYDGAPMTSFVRVTRSDQDALTAGLTQDTAPDDTPTDTSAPELIADRSCSDAQQLTGTLDSGLVGIGTVNDGGFWGFTLDADTAITITAENQDADPVVMVFDADDAMIGENDDFDGLNSQIDFESPMPAGDYCIQITAVNDNDLAITTSVTRFDPTAALRTEIESGAIAPPMDGSFVITDLGTLDSRMRHDLSATPEVQWFQIVMPAAGLMLVEAVAVNDSVDPWMVAYDDLGRKVGQNDDYGENFDSLIAARVPAGTYLIGVKQLEEEGSGPVRMVAERYNAVQ